MQTVFEMDVQQHQLYKISKDDYKSLKETYKADKVSAN